MSWSSFDKEKCHHCLPEDEVERSSGVQIVVRWSQTSMGNKMHVVNELWRLLGMSWWSFDKEKCDHCLPEDEVERSSGVQIVVRWSQTSMENKMHMVDEM